ncbi:MAG: hypothetical protein HOV81_27860 [Kofleriaceae bacterium]|nr:hypothetical protein [Kofleriaceae bacterium]
MAILMVVAAGCGVDESEPVTLTFAYPAPGAAFTRDTLATSGFLVADVGVELDIGGSVAKVGITAGDIALGDLDGEGMLAAQLGALGPVTLTATAVDDAGELLATASVDISVADPEVDSCKGWLDLYKLDYTVGPNNQGVADPITVKIPINGMSFRYSGGTAPRKTLFGDCTLMKSLAEAAPILRAHDVKEVTDIGVYNYRCIDQSLTPPNCSMSQHAYAKAIDLAAFTTTDDTTYTVKTDWVIDPADDTCSASTEGDKDTYLHQLICELKANHVWNIVLTPNYNADHRDHFHVDLTKNSDFITRSLPGLVDD